MKVKRVLALIVCAVMMMGAMPSLAASPDLTIKINGVVLQNGKIGVTLNETGGTVLVPLELKANAGEVKITTIIARDSLSGSPFILGASYTPDNETDGTFTIANGNTRQLIVTSAISDSYNSKTKKEVTYDIYFETGDPLSVTFTVQKNSKGANEKDSNSTTDDDPETTPDPGEVPLLLMLSPVDAYGAAVTAPSGNAGDNVRLRIPILNRGGYYGSNATQIIVTPEISASLDNFPFVVEAVDYSRSVSDLRPGDIQEVNYNFKLSKDVKSGVKEVKFNCVYFNRYKQQYETAKFSVFVTVIKGKEEDDALKDADGETITTQPKIIIESSSLTPDNPQEGDEEGRLYAGETFTLKMTIRNTSSEEAVKNIQVTLSNEGNVVIPANNGSNSLYIDRIEPNGSVEREVKLQSAPDAEPKSQNLTVKFAYESSKTLKGYTEQQDIAVPILQRVRVRVNEPIIYGDGMVEQPISMSLTVYNLSKSTLYYCTVEIEGEGLRMEEPFYYGNVAGGSSMQADFNIIPSVEGNIDGKVVVTFEDAYNKQTRLEKTFTLYVMETVKGDMGFDGEMPQPGMMEPPKTGLPTWAWIAIGVGALMLVSGVFVVIRRRRRKKELTEDV